MNDSWTAQQGMDPYHSKLPPAADYTLGIYIIIIATISACLNGLVLLTIGLRKQPISALDIYIINLALCDLCHSLLGHPIMATGCFKHQWPMGEIGCHIYSSAVFFFGTSDITILSAVCVTRYVKMCCPKANHFITKKNILLSLIPIYGNSLLWSVSPLLGWGSYAPEPFGLSCTLDYKTLPWSYICGIFLFCYIVPLALMTFCYGKITMSVREAKAQMRHIQTKMDSFVTKMSCIMCLFFMVGWTPYTVVSFIYLFNAERYVSHVAAVAAPFFAKSSTCYNPIIYFMSVKRFRDDMKQVLIKARGSSHQRIRRSARGTPFANKNAEMETQKFLFLEKGEGNIWYEHQTSYIELCKNFGTRYQSIVNRVAQTTSVAIESHTGIIDSDMSVPATSCTQTERTFML